MSLKKWIKTILVFVLTVLSIKVEAQLTVNTAVTANDLAATISGQGVIISNPVLTCPNGSYAVFSEISGALGMTDGILLSTGDVNLAIGPNNQVGEGSVTTSSATDPDLTAINSAATIDMCRLEFDIIPLCDTLRLDYVFASEEYPEYVCSDFNDAFAFFISGSNPAGGNYTAENVAIIPGTTVPVAINTVNGGVVGANGDAANCSASDPNWTANSAYYVDNTGGAILQYDGYTTPLTANIPVVSCQTYHMKLVIADATDGAYDSGVFLDFAGLVCPGGAVDLQLVSDTAAEGCFDGEIQIVADLILPTTVNITTGGQAIDGIDISQITTSYNLPTGTSTTPITITALADGLVEGTESLMIYVEYLACGSTPVYDSVEVFILDQPTISFTSTVEDCGACDGTASATFSNAALPIASYVWSPVPGGGQGTANVTGLCEDTYSLSIIDANGCPATDSVVIGTLCPGCLMTGIADTVGVCDLTTNDFPRYGQVTFTDAPATGMLIFTDCLGNADTLLPPFSSPASYYFEANSDGTTNCDITAVFTADATCTINIANDYPVSCACPADAGTVIAGLFGDGNTDYILCHNDTIVIMSNGNDTPPNDVGLIEGDVYNPGLTYGIYSCPPTPSTPPYLDGCFTGYVTGTITNFGDINVDGDAGGFVGALVGAGVVFTDNTVYYAPITLYNQDSLTYNINCVDVGPAIAVQYLPEITTSNPTPDCQDSSFTITVNGGYPELLGGGFTASNLLPATASFVNVTAPNGGTIQINGLQNGDMYSFDITDQNGCPITVSGGPFVGLPNANAGVNDTSCTLTHTMAAIPSIGTGTWTAQAGVSVVPANSATGTATASAAGVYELYWTEDNGLGCTDVDTVVISFSNLSYTTTLIQPTCGNSNGTITVNAIDGLTPYQYSNDSALTFQALDSFPNLAQGSYDVVVVDALGCIQTSDEVLIDSNSPVIDSLSLTQPLCNGDLNGEVVVHATGGVAPYQYSIDAGALQADSLFTGLSGATSYLFTVEDAAGCLDTMSTVLINPTQLVLDSAIGTDVVCNGDDNGTINLYAQGGTGTLTYSIDNDTTYGAASSFTGLAPNTYLVWVKDANGCTDSTQVIIQEPAPISIPNLVDSVVCFGTATGQIQILPQGGNSPYSYGWGPAVSNGTIASNLIAGTYTVTVADAKGCWEDSTFVVYEPAQFTYTTDSLNANCNLPDGWAAVTSFAGGTGTYTYNWDAAAGNQTTDTAFNLVPGNYNVTVTDGNSCDTTITITVGNNPLFTTSITDVVNVKCKDGADGSATANGSDPLVNYTYSWNTVPVQNTQTATGLQAGIWYVVTVTDPATTCFEKDSVLLTEPDSVTIVATGTQTICAGQSADLSVTAQGGSGTYTYTWDNGLGVGQNQTVSPAPGSVTNYTVFATDDSLCTSAPATVTVTVYQELTVVASPNDTICTYESTQLNATPNFGNGGPYSYSWSPSAGLNNSTISNPTANPTQATMYYVTLSDGCSPDVVDSVFVGEWALPIASADATGNVCIDDGWVTFSNTSNVTTTDTNTVTWLFGDGSYATSPWDTISHPYTNAGIYTVSMAVSTPANMGACRDTIVVVPYVEIYALPIPDFLSEPNPTTMFEPEVEFSSAPTLGFPAAWHWDFAGLDSSIFPNPIYQFPNDTSGVYSVTLTVTDMYGCVSSITKTVIVNGEFGLFVPNTFTPDFDNKNDVFMAKGFGIAKEDFSLLIFDRWGEKIFEAHDIDQGWDGFYKGVRVKTDTYVWKIIFKDVNGEKHVKHGHVNIIQ
jgi:gliding motility-associated-like protein